MFSYTVILFIFFGLMTGLRSLHINRLYFREFRTHDLLHGRLDSWLYVVNVISTAVCLVDLFLQIKWLLKGGCRYCGPEWLNYWLIFHFGFSIHAIILHTTTNTLLRKSEFRELFQRSSFGRRTQ